MSDEEVKYRIQHLTTLIQNLENNRLEIVRNFEELNKSVKGDHDKLQNLYRLIRKEQDKNNLIEKAIDLLKKSEVDNLKSHADLLVLIQKMDKSFTRIKRDIKVVIATVSAIISISGTVYAFIMWILPRLH